MRTTLSGLYSDWRLPQKLSGVKGFWCPCLHPREEYRLRSCRLVRRVDSCVHGRSHTSSPHGCLATWGRANQCHRFPDRCLAPKCVACGQGLALCQHIIPKSFCLNCSNQELGVKSGRPAACISASHGLSQMGLIHGATPNTVTTTSWSPSPTRWYSPCVPCHCRPVAIKNRHHRRVIPLFQYGSNWTRSSWWFQPLWKILVQMETFPS